MVSYSDIRKLRKTQKASLYIEVCREVGLVLTWLIMRLFPKVSANAVTVSMLVLNLGTLAVVYRAIVADEIVILVISFLLFNFTICLDCVDGNIARLKRQQSLYGVFLDRVVHNVSYPIFFFVIGVAHFVKHGWFGWIILYGFAGILIELSPIEVALKDVENLFFHQLLMQKTQVYSLEDHASTSLRESVPSPDISVANHPFVSMALRLYSLFPFWNQLFIILFFDMLIGSSTHLVVFLYGLLFTTKQLISQLLRVRSGIATIRKNLELNR